MRKTRTSPRPKPGKLMAASEPPVKAQAEDAPEYREKYLKLLAEKRAQEEAFRQEREILLGRIEDLEGYNREASAREENLRRINGELTGMVKELQKRNAENLEHVKELLKTPDPVYRKLETELKARGKLQNELKQALKERETISRQLTDTVKRLAEQEKK